MSVDGSERTSSQPAELVEPIESVVKQMFASLLDNGETSFAIELTDEVNGKLQDGVARREFTAWLRQLSEPPATLQSPQTIQSWIKSLDSGPPAKSLSSEIALNCLQAVVLAYLPGPRYFEGAYIASQLHKPDRLDALKHSFWVPHLSGTVGWMTANLLHPKTPPGASYVALNDAQVDLRGRVAVSDLWLGNRSVAGFPVGVGAGKQDLASISGFVFFSHPLKGLFSGPLKNGNENTTAIPKAFREVKRLYESTLATAIESYLLRRYGMSILDASKHPKIPQSVQLATLSGNDPTGFLASIHFQSDPTGRLHAECHVNENAFLEAVAQYLRFATVFPARWSTEFLDHMMALGKLLEQTDFGASVPMAWYPQSSTQEVAQFYPPEVLSTLTSRLQATGQQNSWDEWYVRRGDLKANQVSTALAELNELYGPASLGSRQADLVVPIWHEEPNRIPLGFFRINCELKANLKDAPAPQAFQAMWGVLERIHRSLGSAIGALLFQIEQQYVLLQNERPEQERTNRIRKIKLWFDLSYLISDWLAHQMHLLLDVPENVLTALEPDEKLIKFALTETFGEQRGQVLRDVFDNCAKALKLFRESPRRHQADSLPDLTFVSFWQYSRLVVIDKIEDLLTNSPAEDKFAALLLRDPGLLRMLVLLALELDNNEEMDLVGRDSARHGGEVDFGVPTSADISTLSVKKIEKRQTILEVRWSGTTGNNTNEEGALRIYWTRMDGTSQVRTLGLHALAAVPGMVGRRLGHNLFTNSIRMQYRWSEKSKVPKESVGGKREIDKYHDILDFVQSPEGEAENRLRCLEKTLLGPKANPSSANWRILPLSSDPDEFLAALCDSQVNRPTVLAFRDFALANAKAFHIARALDVQKAAAEEYSRNLSAVAHGYKGPIKSIDQALDAAAAAFNAKKKPAEVSGQLIALQEMVRCTEVLAKDAIFYAWRKQIPWKIRPMRWRRRNTKDSLEACLRTVKTALHVPHKRVINYSHEGLGDSVAEEIEVDSYPELWRHLLAKLVENALEHASSPTVTLKASLDKAHIVISLSNPVKSDSLAESVQKVRETLQSGNPGKLKDHGYGLVEAHRCCELLQIEPDVKEDAGSQLVILLPLVLKK